MKDLKLTIKIFLGAIFFAAILGRMDYETESFSQIFFTLDGQLFLLLYGFVLTLIAWIFIGFTRLENRYN